MTALNFTDCPAWDCSITIGGETFDLVSPLEVTADMAMTPTPDQAAIDAMTRRRAGIFRRAWWWLFGDPRRVTAAGLHTDGGAGHTRAMAGLIVRPAQRPLLDGLSTGQVTALVSAYLAAQQAYFEGVGAWAKASVDAGMPDPHAPHGPADGVASAGQRTRKVTPANAVEMFTELLGPPTRGYATGILPHHGPQDLNGQVYGEGGPR